MKRATLTHIYEERDDQALGVFQLEGRPEALFTNEPGLDEAKPRLPDGEYLARWVHSARFGWTWTLVGEGVSAEPNQGQPRSCVRFHSGNRDEDSEGCVLFGLEIGWVSGEPAVLRSRPAMETLKDWLRGEDFLLTIRSGRLVETTKG